MKQPACDLMVFCLASMLLFLPSLVARGDITGEASDSSRQGVALQVYKKWIGASGSETRVEINLVCEDGDTFQPRFIDRDHPDGWIIKQVPASGMFCSVTEVAKDTFVPNVEDCRNLLVVPGQEAECTMVNTKVVKRINMFNRYGLGLMILVMLTAGLVSVRRLSQS
jgi:hypothetical protein